MSSSKWTNVTSQVGHPRVCKSPPQPPSKPGPTTTGCPSLTPANKLWYVTVLGVSGPGNKYALYNGTFSLTFTTACTWVNPANDPFTGAPNIWSFLVSGTAPNATVTLRNGQNTQNYVATGIHNGTVPITLTRTTSVPVGQTWPATLTITPA